MFKISSGDYYWPITISSPCDSGKHEKYNIELKFLRLKQSQIEEIVKNIDNGDLNSVDSCKTFITGWKGVDDVKGDPVVFNEENLEQFLEIPGISQTIFQEYFKSLKGAKQKN